MSGNSTFTKIAQSFHLIITTRTPTPSQSKFPLKPPKGYSKSGDIYREKGMIENGMALST